MYQDRMQKIADLCKAAIDVSNSQVQDDGLAVETIIRHIGLIATKELQLKNSGTIESSELEFWLE
jgi:hypothetical protein